MTWWKLSQCLLGVRWKRGNCIGAIWQLISSHWTKVSTFYTSRTYHDMSLHAITNDYRSVNTKNKSDGELPRTVKSGEAGPSRPGRGRPTSYRQCNHGLDMETCLSGVSGVVFGGGSGRLGHGTRTYNFLPIRALHNGGYEWIDCRVCTMYEQARPSKCEHRFYSI